MRFMILVKANKDTENEGAPPDPQLMADMNKFNDELLEAGVLLGYDGLHPSSKGARVHFSGKNRTVTDGPFAETKELLAGYTIIKVSSRAEAMEWAKRYPNPAGEGEETEIEVRQLFELEDFAPGGAVERFRQLGLESKR